MALEFAPREHEGITILDIKGSLRFGHEDSDLRTELEKLCRAGVTQLVLNLKHVEHIDTTGLGTLLFALAKLQKAGGRLVLLNLNPAHVDLVVAAKLDSIFETYKEELDAINSFFPDRKIPHFDILDFVRHTEESEEKKRA